MEAREWSEGDALSRSLIADYWRAFTGTDQTWNFYLEPLRWDQLDRWATRDQWITAAEYCLQADTKVICGLEILLAEGFTQHLPQAVKIVEEWLAESGGHDPEYYCDLLARFPADSALRAAHLPTAEPGHLASYERSALIAVGDERVCAHLAGRIREVFSADHLDEAAAENEALPRMAELGPLCGRYLEAPVIEAAKRFCLSWLQRDKDIAPDRQRLFAEVLAGARDERVQWVSGDIAHWSWRLGWTDVLQHLTTEAWYWSGMFAESYSDYENTDLLVWSRYLDSELLRKRALHVMRTHEDHKLDGAIAWARMGHARRPGG